MFFLSSNEFWLSLHRMRPDESTRLLPDVRLQFILFSIITSFLPVHMCEDILLALQFLLKNKINFFTISLLFSSRRAALDATSKLYDSVDEALHRLVQVSNQRGRDLEALGRLAGLVDKLEKVCGEGSRWVWSRYRWIIHCRLLSCHTVAFHKENDVYYSEST